MLVISTFTIRAIFYKTYFRILTVIIKRQARKDYKVAATVTADYLEARKDYKVAATVTADYLEGA